VRRDEKREASTRLAVAASLFLALVAAALLIGGHAVIGPMLQSAAAARDAKRVGDVVYAMPDGSFCRHLSFDNATAEIAESTVVPCPRDIIRDRPPQPKGFAWGGR
jgi:hypothetical protein